MYKILIVKVFLVFSYLANFNDQFCLHISWAFHFLHMASMSLQEHILCRQPALILSLSTITGLSVHHIYNALMLKVLQHTPQLILQGFHPVPCGFNTSPASHGVHLLEQAGGISCACGQTPKLCPPALLLPHHDGHMCPIVTNSELSLTSSLVSISTSKWSAYPEHGIILQIL